MTYKHTFQCSLVRADESNANRDIDVTNTFEIRDECENNEMLEIPKIYANVDIFQHLWTGSADTTTTKVPLPFPSFKYNGCGKTDTRTDYLIHDYDTFEAEFVVDES